MATQKSMSKVKKVAMMDPVLEFFSSNGYPNAAIIDPNKVVRIESLMFCDVQLKRYANKANWEFLVFGRSNPEIRKWAMGVAEKVGDGTFADLKVRQGKPGKHGDGDRVVVAFDSSITVSLTDSSSYKKLLEIYEKLRDRLLGDGILEEKCDADNNVSDAVIERAVRYYRAHRDEVDLMSLARKVGGKAKRVRGTDESYKLALHDLEKRPNPFASLRPYLGFNAFNILKLDEQEIRHSNVWAWLWNANANHGLGAHMVNDMLEHLKKSMSREHTDGLQIPPDVKKRISEIKSLNDARVLREDDHTDLKLESEKHRLLIVIENKWNADAGPSQLMSYYGRVQQELSRRNALLADDDKKWVAVFSYLTLLGERTDPKNDDKHWLTLSYLDLKQSVAEALADDSISLLPQEREFLMQYYRVLERKEELMRPKDALVQAGIDVFKSSPAALDLVARSESALARRQLEKVGQTLADAVKASEMEQRGSFYCISHGQDYRLQLEVNVCNDRVCCNIWKRQKTVKWHEKSVKGTKNTNDRNWKPFDVLATSGWSSLECAAKDAFDEAVAWLRGQKIETPPDGLIICRHC